MKKLFKDNPPRFFFWVGFAIVVLLVLGGTGYTVYLISVDKTGGTEKTATDSDSQTFEITEEQAKNSNKLNTLSGTVTAVAADSITASSNGVAKKLAITKTTTITKGTSSTGVAITEITTGKNVSISYNNETQEAINVWFQE